MKENNIRIEHIPVRELETFAERAISGAGPGGYVPISMQRAIAHAHNPYAHPDDVGLLAAIVMGWVAVGAWLGERLFRNNDWSFPLKVTVGTLFLSFGIGLIGLVVPFLSGLLSIIISSMGLGAVALTKFGRQSYPEANVADSVNVDEDKVEVVLRTLPEDDDPVTKG